MLYLASTSPRRHEILQQMHVKHQILQVPAPEGEDEPILSGESAQDYVLRTALEKAQRALAYIKQESLPPHWILSADTTVILDQAIIGKALCDEDVKNSLTALSGRSHEVRTAVILMNKDGHYQQALSISKIVFDDLSKDDIQEYIRTGEGIGKAGAYAIQGYAARFIKRIEGSYSGVMGLPIFEVSQLLKNTLNHCISR